VLTEKILPDDPQAAVGRVLQLVNEGYRVLADLHEAVLLAPGDPAPALDHLTRATRELASVQGRFERRGR
jgi:hypothetical protein